MKMGYEEAVESRREELEEMVKQKEAEQRKSADAEMQLAAVTRKIMTEQARERLNNVKLVNRELYMQAVQVLVYMHQTGNASGKISEEQLKGILKKLAAKRDTKIVRK